MRILVCGSRHWPDAIRVQQEIAQLQPPDGSTIIHGCAEGADRMAGEAARIFGFWEERYPAEWEKHGKAAGPIRNSRMLKEGKPDLVLAFTADLETSRGTRDMVKKAQAAGLPVRLVTHVGVTDLGGEGRLELEY